MIIIEEITPEESAQLKEKFARQSLERAAYVAQAISDTPYSAMPLDEKREIAREVLKPFSQGEGARKVEDMDEAAINNILMVYHDFMQPDPEFDEGYVALTANASIRNDQGPN